MQRIRPACQRMNGARSQFLDVAKTQFRAVTKHGLQFGETGNKRRELMALWLKFKNEPLTEQSSQKRCDEYVDHLVVRDE